MDVENGILLIEDAVSTPHSKDGVHTVSDGRREMGHEVRDTPYGVGLIQVAFNLLTLIVLLDHLRSFEGLVGNGCEEVHGESVQSCIFSL